MSEQDCQECAEAQKDGYTHCSDCGESVEQRRLPQNYCIGANGQWEFNPTKAALLTADNE